MRSICLSIGLLADPLECGAAASNTTLERAVMRIIEADVKVGPRGAEGRPV